MFTGIITHLGKISKKEDKRLTIKTTRDFLSKVKKGVSVSINGICLTVVNVDKPHFQIDFMPETENRTNIKYLKPETIVNLELPATPISFLSGHIIQGHVDGTSKLLNIIPSGNSRILKFSVSSTLTKHMVEKGSITVKNSFEARKGKSETPICNFLTGYLEGFLSEVLDENPSR